MYKKIMVLLAVSVLLLPYPTWASGGSGSRGYTTTQIFSTVGSSYEYNAGEPSPCGVTVTATEWYAYQQHTTGILEMNTFGSTCDTVLGVYIGPGDSFATLTNVGCNDNFDTNLTSKVVIVGTPGTIYWIQACKKAGSGTKINLNRRWIPTLFTGDSDSVTLATNVIQVAATNSPKPCNITCTYEYWARIDVMASGTLTVDTVGSATGFNTVLALYTGTEPLDFSTLVPLNCNDDYAGLGTKSRVAVSVTGGTTLWAQVGGKSGTKGTAKVNYSLTP